MKHYTTGKYRLDRYTYRTFKEGSVDDVDHYEDVHFDRSSNLQNVIRNCIFLTIIRTISKRMNLNYLVTILFTLLWVQAKSQTPNWVWARSPVTGSRSQALGEGWRNSTDAVGNNNIVGFYRDTLIFGTDTLINGNLNNITAAFIARYNSSGNILWAKSSSGNGNAFCNSAASDQYGNSYIGGYMNTGSLLFDTITLNNSGSGGKTMFIVKYDSLGNAVWGRSFGALGHVDLENIATDAVGNVYATGYFLSQTVSFDTFTLTNTDTSLSTTDFFLVKFDSSGTVLWAKTGIGLGVEYGIGVATDANNNVYVTGHFSSSQFIIETDTLNNHSALNKHDAFLAKFDSNGNLIWARGAGGTEQDYPVALAVNAQGDAFVTGFFDSPTLIFGATTLTNIALYTTFIFNYTSNGNTGWAKSPSSGGGNGRSIATDNCGNVFVAGSMTNDTIIFDSTILSQDSVYADNMYLIRLNSVGNVIWGLALPFGGDDAISIVCDDFDNAYLGGDVLPPFAIIGNDTLINTEGETPFQAKLHFNCTVGNSEYEYISESHLFPNPFNEELNISVNFNGESEIILYDIAGRRLLQQQFNNTISINTAYLAKGIYLYEVRQKNNLCSAGKVVKN